MKYRYAKIGYDTNSRTIWVSYPFDVIGGNFKTSTRFLNSNLTECKIVHDKKTDIYSVYSKEDVTYFNICSPSEANYIILPYCGNNDFKEIVSIIDDTTFVIREKVFIESFLEKENGITLPNGRDNEILGCIYLKHQPCESPKYDGDCDTIIKVYNKNAIYLKKELTVSI